MVAAHLDWMCIVCVCPASTLQIAACTRQEAGLLIVCYMEPLHKIVDAVIVFPPRFKLRHLKRNLDDAADMFYCRRMVTQLLSMQPEL